MIVTRLEEIQGTPHHILGKGWQSTRILVGKHGMGFSVHDTIIYEGTENQLEYKHHLEANYCVSGEGEVVDLATGETYPIKPGTLYALDKHDAHIVRATKGDLRLICVFNPALTGEEVHTSDGSYPALRPEQ